MPSTWENEGKLKWPPKKFIGRALKNNMPPESDWTEFPCTLKQKNLTSQQATEMMKTMSTKSDTDDTPNLIASPRDRKSVCNNADSARIDHNALFVSAPAKVDGSSTRPHSIILQTHQTPSQGIDQNNEFFGLTGVNKIASSSTPTQGIILQTHQTNHQHPPTIVSLQQHQMQQLQQQQQNQILYNSMNSMVRPEQHHQSPQFMYSSDNAIDPQASSFVLPSDTRLTEYAEEEVNTESIDIQTLMGILSSIVESQSKIEVKMGEMVKIMNKNFAIMFKILEAKQSQPETPPVDLDAGRFEVIDTVEKLEAFEEDLKEAEYANSMVS